MRKIFLRLDDACHTMAWSKWRALERLLDEFDIKPILGVIPDCCDQKMHYEQHNEGFWEWVRAVQAKGWVVGMHGFEHKYVTADAGLIPINQQSEFAGLSYEEQRRKIESSQKIFDEQQVRPVIWIAPSHSFDRTTIDVLRDVTDIRLISDGISYLPYVSEGFLWIPQQQWRLKKTGFGVETICLHPNWMTIEEIDALRPVLQAYLAHLHADIGQMQALYGTRNKSWRDSLYFNYFFARKRLVDFIYPNQETLPAKTAPTTGEVAYSSTIASRNASPDVIDDEMEYKQLLQHLPKDKDAAILEIGCGPGDFLMFMRNHGYRNVIGIDRDAVIVEYAQKRGADKVVCADAIAYINTQCEEGFDVIIMNNVIEHFSKQALLAMLPTIRKKLKENGVFVAKTGNIENPLNIGLFLRDITHEIGFTKNSFRQLLLMSGFAVDAVHIHDIKFRSRNLVRTALVRIVGGMVAFVIRIAAKSMGCRIDSMSRLIYCVARR